MNDGHTLDPNTKFTTPLGVGLYGLMLSSGKSIFVYSPFLLYALSGFRQWFGKNFSSASLVLAVSVVYVVFYGKLAAWGGDWSYGPRFMMAILPLLAIASAFLVEETLQGASRRGRIGLWALIFLSIAVQIPGLAVDPQMRMESLWQTQGQLGFERRTWNPAYCPVLDQARSMVRLLRGESAWDVKAGEETIQETEWSKLSRNNFDFWWIYAYKGGLLPAWLSILAAASCLLGGIALWYPCWRLGGQLEGPLDTLRLLG